MKVICVDISKGKVHDFNLFKKSGLKILIAILLLADSGYQGICKYHSNSKTPVKSSKKHKLSAQEKEFNCDISKKRIYIERNYSVPYCVDREIIATIYCSSLENYGII